MNRLFLPGSFVRQACRLLACGGALALAVLFLTPLSLSADGDFSGSSKGGDQTVEKARTGKVRDAAWNELSGMAVGRRDPNMLWVHNDSGSDPLIVALTCKGETAATYRLDVDRGIDWEDMAICGGGERDEPPRIFIGDIGDNQGKRETVCVYVFPEPDVSQVTSDAIATIEEYEKVVLRYPGQPQDAETLLVDPFTRDIYVLAKRSLRPRLYRAPKPDAFGQTQTLEFVATAPFAIPTGGDIAPDGRSILIRTYGSAGLWRRQPSESLAQALSRLPDQEIDLSHEPLGEAIAFDAKHAHVYYTISEGAHQPIYRYELQERADDSSSAGAGRPSVGN